MTPVGVAETPERTQDMHMNKLGRIALVITLVLGLAGCGTVKPVDANTWARDFYGQPNTAQILHVEGTNICFTLSGASVVTLSTPIPCKQMIPRDVSWMDSLMDGVKTVAPWVAMGYLGSHMDAAAGATTVRGATTITPAGAAATPATP
jgi:hypothetical protein